MDYDKPGHPPLTPNEVASIRSALARVKPCQRTLVRYAFPANTGLMSFVLFFEPHDGGNVSHIFGETNMLYSPWDGQVFPASPDDSDSEQIDKFGIQYLIDQQKCAPAPE